MTAKSFGEWWASYIKVLGPDYHNAEAMAGMEEAWNASRAALLSPDVRIALRLCDAAEPTKYEREEIKRALESLAAHNAALAAQVAERDAEIARLKMENSKLRSALEIVHFKREPWQ